MFGSLLFTSRRSNLPYLLYTPVTWRIWIKASSCTTKKEEKEED